MNMTFVSDLSLFMYVIAFVGCAGPSVRELVRYDGSITQKKHQWQYVHQEKGKKVYVPFEGIYESKGGRIQSPIFAFDKKPGESAYYSLKFKAQTDAHCYWWVDLFDAEGGPLPDINSAVYPGPKTREYSQMIYVEGPVVSGQLAFASQEGVAVSDVVMRKVPLETAAEWCDKMYEELAPLDFTAPVDSFKLLPKTAAALKDGRPWRIVMLGDSVMNDSFNSIFQALVEREFPESNLEFINSVRGSTGCWYYEDKEHFDEYVTKHKPDLLMIGGISNLEKEKGRENIPVGLKQIASVIDQAKALGCEVVLLSQPHAGDWRPFDEANPDAPLPATDWNEEMLDSKGWPYLSWSPYEKVAKECGIAFWNMTVPTTDYVAKSGKPHNWFNRDVVHNNDRGKQIIGRVMFRYFCTAKCLPSL